MADYSKKMDDNDKMTIMLDDGTELVCDVLAIVDEGEHEYIALLPEDAGEEDDIFLYRFKMNGDDFDNIELENIEDDDEFDRAAQAFEDYMEQMEIIDDEE